MKTIRLRIVGIENTHEINVASFIKKQSSQGVHPKSTRNFNSIINLTTEYMPLNYCLSFGITLVYKELRFFYFYMYLHRSHLVRVFIKIDERKSNFFR